MNKAAFFDRDGIINQDLHYVYRPKDIVFLEGIFDFLHYVQERGFMLFIITNQSGIAKKYFSEKQFLFLTKWIEKQFRTQGIHIKKTYYAPYGPSLETSSESFDPFDRKPNPGMIFKAQKEFQIDLTKSFLVGDRSSDIQAGIAAGIPLNILLNKNDASSSNNVTCPVISAVTLEEVREILIHYFGE